MGWGTVITRLNLAKVLKLIVLFEMLFWFLMGAATLMIYNFKDKSNPDVLNEIKAEYGSSKQNANAEAKYRALIREWQQSTNWIVVTAAVLFFIQILLLLGLIHKNRCLIVCWMLFTLMVAIIRIIIIATANVSSSHNYLKYTSLLWAVRTFYAYLAAKYMLQITNENLGAEEVEPPHFRPQTDDPREFREGLNYPTYPRNLEFAGRIAAMNKQEHVHPKRFVATYDAFDSDGRMVVVVDDPVYEAL